MNRETGDIHQHEIAVDLMEHPALPFQVRPHLGNTGLHRYIQHRPGGLAHSAVRRQVLFLLKTFHCSFQFPVIQLALNLIGRQQASRHQPFT